MGALEGLEAPWIWLTLGIVLAGLEMVLPGVYLIWLAVAAILTGLLAFAVDIGMPLEVLVFVCLSLATVFAARKFLKDRPIESPDPQMNRRGARMIGQVVRVTRAIEDGEGRVHHGDSEWLARGPDAPVGARMRISGSDGAVLLVEPAPQPD